MTPLALINDKDSKVNVLVDAALIKNSSDDVLMHPIAGNTYTVCMSMQQLVKYMAHTNHSALKADFVSKTITQLA